MVEAPIVQRVTAESSAFPAVGSDPAGWARSAVAPGAIIVSSSWMLKRPERHTGRARGLALAPAPGEIREWLTEVGAMLDRSATRFAGGRA